VATVTKPRKDPTSVTNTFLHVRTQGYGPIAINMNYVYQVRTDSRGIAVFYFSREDSKQFLVADEPFKKILKRLRRRA
jgi:hypothetical protein